MSFKLIGRAKFNNIQSEDVELELLPPPKVLVNFRAHNRYKGEYGFDWMRMGDTRKPGDSWYRDIIGGYSTGSFVQDTAEYTKLGRKYEMPKHPIKANDRYIVPVLTLLPTKKAKFSLKVEIQLEAIKIEFKYDKKLFKLNQTEVSYKTKGKKTLADYLEIECLKEFGTDQYIEVLADRTFAGKIKVLANDKAHRYQADIVFVRVITDLTGVGGAGNKGGVTGEKTFLEKYLNQAYTKSNIVTKVLDLRTDTVLNGTYTKVSGGKTVIDPISGLHAHLETKFATVHSGYSTYFKVFFFDEKSTITIRGTVYNVNGEAKDINSKSVVLYNTHNTSTTMHELFHAMGLWHSFSDSGEFTFEKGKTENIMDYSHQPSYGSINRISTWQWQWVTIHPNLIKEP